MAVGGGETTLVKTSGLGTAHDNFLAAKLVHLRDLKDAWGLALESVGAPKDTAFYAGETDTAEWTEYNNLMTNYLGFCKDYETGGKA